MVCLRVGGDVRKGAGWGVGPLDDIVEMDRELGKMGREVGGEVGVGGGVDRCRCCEHLSLAVLLQTSSFLKHMSVWLAHAQPPSTPLSFTGSSQPV